METKRTIERVKEPVVRGVAVQVFLVAAAAAVTGQVFLSVFLALDFLIRAFIHPRYSLTALISRRFLASVLGFRSRIILYKPKRFAAGIGFALSLGGVFFGLTGLSLWMRIFSAVLAGFSFAEGFFGFCAGCKIFGLLIHFKLIKAEVCEDCVLDGDV